MFASNWDIERQRREDRTKRIQNNDYKSSIKRPALICLKKTETVAVFSRRRMSRLTFQKVFCLQTKLSDLKLIGVFTSKIITFHFGNLRRARANKSISIIWRETEKMVACTSYFFSLLCLCGWLSSDGGADFNKGCDCSQLEAG